MQHRHLLGVILLSLNAAACATVGGMRTAPLEAGVTRVYDAPTALVVLAARRAMLEAGLHIVGDSQVDPTVTMIIGRWAEPVLSRGRIVRAAIFGADGLVQVDHGEYVRAIVQELPQGVVAVRVISRRRDSNPVGDPNWPERIFVRINETLGTSAIAAADSSDPARRSPTAAGSRTDLVRAATIRSLAERELVRVRGGSIGTVQGWVLGTTDTALWLTTDTAAPAAIPIAAIDSLWIHRPDRRIGTALGGAAGLGLGAAVARAACASLTCVSLAPGLTGIAGAVIGHSVAGGRWKLYFP